MVGLIVFYLPPAEENLVLAGYSPLQETAKGF